MNETDLLLINRSGRDYALPATEIEALTDDADLLVVNRDGVDYKVSAKDLKNYLSPSLWDGFKGPVLHIQELEDPGVGTMASIGGGDVLPVKVYDLDGNFLEETWQLETAKFGKEFVILVEMDEYDYESSSWNWYLTGLFARGRLPNSVGNGRFDCKFGPLTDVSMVTDFRQMFYDCGGFTGKGSLGTWNTKSAKTMWRMFDRNDGFVEDISEWCVPLIAPGSNESDLRAYNLPAEHEPKWGTCPRGEDQDP